MAGELEFFKQFLYEAPGDDPPPDIDTGGDDSPPPDIPEDNSYDMGSDDPPDLPNAGGMDDAPPDMGDDDNFDGDDFSGDDSDQGEPEKNLELDEKISAIMNRNLYQRFLELLGNITSQISQMKENSDVLNNITTDSQDIVTSLSDLEENIRLYLKNYFVNESYSKNLLFFNKCLNLLALLNTIFDDAIKKGIKHVDV